MYNLFEDEPDLNEHELAWMNQDWESVKKLADSYKENSENVMFAILNGITVSKDDLTIEQKEQYSKHWIDNALSQHVDCIIPVHYMNLYGSELSDEGHYNYYRAAIQAGKRYGKWAKYNDDSEYKVILQLISMYYVINTRDADEYYKIMKAKGTLSSFLKKTKAMVTEDFLKSVIKNKTDRTKINKLIKAW